MENYLLLLRISKPEYNRTLYDEYALYMNPQMVFKDESFSEGRYDKSEGLVAGEGTRLFALDPEEKIFKEMHGIVSIHKNCNAYIFCMYGVKFVKEKFNASLNKYVYDIPWKCIEGLWCGEDTEMLVIENTSVFIEKFEMASKREGLRYDCRAVKYDLDEKIGEMEYHKGLLCNEFESVFHKIKNYEIQNEVRFVIRNDEIPQFYKLVLDKNPVLRWKRFRLEKGKGVRIVLKDFKFQEQKPYIRFSPEVEFYYL